MKLSGGIAGVIDGPCTDAAEIVGYDLPVWSRGVSPITTGKYDLGGRLNQPVSVGGVVVMPGDYVLCDPSGVLVLPPEEAEAEARRALSVQEKGAASRQKIIDGARMSEVYGAKTLVDQALAGSDPI